jgi:hypothetical protein
MKTKIIELTKSTVIFTADTTLERGAEINLEVRLPQEALLESFVLKGTIRKCTRIQNIEGLSGYVVEMNIGDLPEMNEKILEAYMDFLEREKKLNGIKIDHKALQKAFENFGTRLEQLIAVSEMLTKATRGKITIH